MDKKYIIIFLLLLIIILFILNKKENLPNEAIQNLSSICTNTTGDVYYNNIDVSGITNMAGNVNIVGNLELSKNSNLIYKLQNFSYMLSADNTGYNLYYIDRNNNKTKIINFDASGNINLSRHTKNNNLTTGLIMNGPIKGVLSKSSNNKPSGFRMWMQNANNTNNVTSLQGFFIPISQNTQNQLSDGTYSSFSADDWVVICVGAEFISGDSTGVYTFIQNNIWYTNSDGPNGSNGDYNGYYLAIPKNYFEYVDTNLYG
jgi:hypothetical protein